MAEEQKCQPPRLCANNCGFFGSQAMQDLCSRCYRDLQLKEQQSSSAKLVMNKSLSPSYLKALPTLLLAQAPETVSIASSQPAVDLPIVVEEEKILSVVPSPSNRCRTCRKRVGLTGFKCRCGLTFCGSHRYPEKHACEFDFKSMGREQIAKQNPLVKAEKLEKL